MALAGEVIGHSALSAIARLWLETVDQIDDVKETAVKGPDYPSETFQVLKPNEIKRYGEYRTARLVLDARDRMERGELK